MKKFPGENNKFPGSILGQKIFPGNYQKLGNPRDTNALKTGMANFLT